MPGIGVRSFIGMLPMQGPESLPNEAAQLALNCRLEGSDLEPWNDTLDVLTLTSLNPVASIYRFNIASSSETQFWFQFDTDVDVVKGPIAGDVEERTYWTGDGSYPKKANNAIATGSAPYPTTHFRLGIPAPTSAPSVSISGTNTAPNDPMNTSTWGFTYVTTWDEEGPMSPLSSVQTWGTGQTPQVSGLGSAPPGGPYSINRKRLYRSNTGAGSTDLQFVTELPITTASFTDTVAGSALGRVSETRLWVPPPDNIIGLCSMANEMLAAFYGNTVVFSEPGVPYAWPARYSYPFDSPIIGIKPFGQSLLVCTLRGTWILRGVDPGQMSSEFVKAAGTCLSKRGMVRFDRGVAYPEKLGLRYVGDDGTRLLTDDAFNEISWAAYAPSSMLSAVVSGRIVICFNTGAKQGSLVFSFTTPSTIVESTVFGTAMFTEDGTDRLYIVQSNHIKRWDGGSAQTYKWHSKRYRFPRPISMARAKVEADTYPVTLRVYSAGTLLHTEAVADKYAFPITSGDDAHNWEFELEGTSRVTAVTLATSMDELKLL
jgi:hypothetical protein